MCAKCFMSKSSLINHNNVLYNGRPVEIIHFEEEQTN